MIFVSSLLWFLGCAVVSLDYEGLGTEYDAQCVPIEIILRELHSLSFGVSAWSGFWLLLSLIGLVFPPKSKPWNGVAFAVLMIFAATAGVGLDVDYECILTGEEIAEGVIEHAGWGLVSVAVLIRIFQVSGFSPWQPSAKAGELVKKV